MCESQWKAVLWLISDVCVDSGGRGDGEISQPFDTSDLLHINVIIIALLYK